MNEKIEIDKEYFDRLVKEHQLMSDLVVRVYYVIEPCHLFITETSAKDTFKVVSRSKVIFDAFGTIRDLETWHLTLDEIQMITDVMNMNQVASEHCREQWDSVLKVAKEFA